MAEKRTHWPTAIAERAALAVTYAEDGAYSSAWRILDKLATELGQHARQVAEAEARMMSRLPSTASPPPPSSGPAVPRLAQLDLADVEPRVLASEPQPLQPHKPGPIGRDYSSAKPLDATTLPAHRHIWHVDVLNSVRTCEVCGAEEIL